MRDNVLTIDAILASGEQAQFGPIGPANTDLREPEIYRRLTQTLIELADRESDEITTRFPKVHRRVGGYNIDAMLHQRYSSVNKIWLNCWLVQKARWHLHATSVTAA